MQWQGEKLSPPAWRPLNAKANPLSTSCLPASSPRCLETSPCDYAAQGLVVGSGKPRFSPGGAPEPAGTVSKRRRSPDSNTFVCMYESTVCMCVCTYSTSYLVCTCRNIHMGHSIHQIPPSWTRCAALARSGGRKETRRRSPSREAPASSTLSFAEPNHDSVHCVRGRWAFSSLSHFRFSRLLLCVHSRPWPGRHISPTRRARPPTVPLSIVLCCSPGDERSSLGSMGAYRRLHRCRGRRVQYVRGPRASLDSHGRVEGLADPFAWAKPSDEVTSRCLSIPSRWMRRCRVPTT